MSFVFYDTETTGIQTAFDQILQFAAIRTDSELNEIERFEVRSRLLPHVVPSPGAMKVTRISASQLVDPKIPSHYEMICSVRTKLLAWSPAVFIGFNSLDFDEHLLRQAFYQTLHPVYLTNTNGNCRADAMKVAQATSLFAPDALKFPTDGKGNKSYKLDQLAPLNGFDHFNAHDALGDVEATIHICRLVAERAPDLWSSLIRFSKKAVVQDYVVDDAIFALTDFYYGKPYSWIVCPVRSSLASTTDLLVFDLACNPKDLEGLAPNKLKVRLGQNPKPIRRIRANACPIIMPVEDAPDLAKAKALPAEELQRRVELLLNSEPLRDRLVQAFEETRDEKAKSIHIEEQIYDSFSSDSDVHILAEFHDAPWAERIDLIEKLSDVRLKELGLRLICIESPSCANEKLRMKIEREMAQRLSGATTGPWLSLPKAIQDMEKLLQSETGDHLERLRAHQLHLHERLGQITGLL